MNSPSSWHFDHLRSFYLGNLSDGYVAENSVLGRCYLPWEKISKRCLSLRCQRYPCSSRTAS